MPSRSALFKKTLFLFVSAGFAIFMASLFYSYFSEWRQLQYIQTTNRELENRLASVRSETNEIFQKIQLYDLENIGFSTNQQRARQLIQNEINRAFTNTGVLFETIQTLSPQQNGSAGILSFDVKFEGDAYQITDVLSQLATVSPTLKVQTLHIEETKTTTSMNNPQLSVEMRIVTLYTEWGG